jgi:hypothetical protein
VRAGARPGARRVGPRTCATCRAALERARRQARRARGPHQGKGPLHEGGRENVSGDTATRRSARTAASRISRSMPPARVADRRQRGLGGGDGRDQALDVGLVPGERRAVRREASVDPRARSGRAPRAPRGRPRGRVFLPAGTGRGLDRGPPNLRRLRPGREVLAWWRSRSAPTRSPTASSRRAATHHVRTERRLRRDGARPVRALHVDGPRTAPRSRTRSSASSDRRGLTRAQSLLRRPAGPWRRVDVQDHAAGDGLPAAGLASTNRSPTSTTSGADSRIRAKAPRRPASRTP